MFGDRGNQSLDAAFIHEGGATTLSQLPLKPEPNPVAAMRHALEISTNLVYLARLTNSRDEAYRYLERAEGQLHTIGVLLAGISSQERAVQ